MAEDNPEELHTAEEEWKNAVRNSHLHSVQRILRNGSVDVDRECFGSGCTALHIASAGGDLRIMRVLLEHGANVNHQKRHGCTALQTCVYLKRVAGARLLLEHGTDPHSQTKFGWVALHCASSCNDTDFIRLLIEHGAPPDSRDHDGRTPLHTLVSIPRNPPQRTVEAARLLLENGSNANNRDNEGNSVLWTACSCFPAVMRLLLQHGATVTDKDPLSGKTLLHRLAKSLAHDDAEKTMEALLEHGADPRVRDSKGKLPLDVACAKKVALKADSATNMNAIYILFQRMIGDGSLTFRKQKSMH